MFLVHQHAQPQIQPANTHLLPTIPLTTLLPSSYSPLPAPFAILSHRPCLTIRFARSPGDVVPGPRAAPDQPSRVRRSKPVGAPALPAAASRRPVNDPSAVGQFPAPGDAPRREPSRVRQPDVVPAGTHPAARAGEEPMQLAVLAAQPSGHRRSRWEAAGAREGRCAYSGHKRR